MLKYFLPKVVFVRMRYVYCSVSEVSVKVSTLCTTSTTSARSSFAIFCTPTTLNDHLTEDKCTVSRQYLQLLSISWRRWRCLPVNCSANFKPLNVVALTPNSSAKCVSYDVSDSAARWARWNTSYGSTIKYVWYFWSPSSTSFRPPSLK